MIRTTLKFILPVFLSVLIISCSSSKSVLTATRDDVKGRWTLNDIRYDGLQGSDNVRITLLDEGDRDCLRGSSWNFPNNGNGSYNITSNSAGCVAGDRNIVWSYQVENGQAILQYKLLPGGVKATQIKDGYKFKINSVSKTNLTLQSEVTFEGKPLFIIYDFTKS